MKHKFEIGDVIFYPLFNFNGFFQKINSETITGIDFKDDKFFYRTPFQYLEENRICSTFEEAEKLATRMVIRDINERYEPVKNMCEKHQMIPARKIENENESGNMVETPQS